MRSLIIIPLLLMVGNLYSQTQYYSKNTQIRFLSKAPIEQIEAVHKTATTVLDLKTGAIQFAVLMAGFNFEKAMMQQHFNENYAESDRYPQAIFKGTIINFAPTAFEQNGSYEVEVEGIMTLHGVSKSMKAKGRIVRKDKQLQISSNFTLLLPDYKIKNDKLQQISNQIQVQVEANLQPLQKN